jgi:hypothetical protein
MRSLPMKLRRRLMLQLALLGGASGVVGGGWSGSRAFGAALEAGKLEAAPEGTFSIVLIPDTQAYKGAGTKGNPTSTDPVTNAIFEAHVKWIAENLERQRIAFVSHVGDIVDIDEPRQWEVARACMDRIHGRVPYGISVGNHDMSSNGDARLFQKYFPASRFAEFSWYGGTFPGSAERAHVSGDNANSFQRFAAGGIEFVFLHLECNAPDDVVAWANGVLEQHADRAALVTSHMGWGPRVKPATNEEFIHAPKGRMEWGKIHGARGNTPAQLWEKCYRKHANLLCVFSGDQSRTQAIRATTAGDHGNEVHELLQDYGSGWLRIYRFTPAENRVQAMTFKPGTEELCTGTTLVADAAQHQFEFNVPLAKRMRSGARTTTRR